MNTVQPIRDADLIDRVQTELAKDTDWHGKRIYLLFMTGIYTGLRISDIIRLQGRHVNHGDYIRLTEEKTGKRTEIKINQVLRIVYDERLKDIKDNEYLFPSRQHDKKGNVTHIKRRMAEQDMKTIAKRFGIEFPFSCHSMRKTFGYFHYKQHGDIETLRYTFHHASVDVTRRYIGIDEEERARMIEDLRIGTYKPKRTEPAKKRSNQVNAPLTTKYHDRTKQGLILAEKMRAKAKKKKATAAGNKG